MITAQEIQDKLNAEYVGQEYKEWYNDTYVQTAVKTLCVDNNVDYDEIYANNNRQTAYIKYRREIIGEVKVKKAKGAHHYQYGQSWNDWTYKGFEVNLYFGDLQECMKHIDAKFIEREKAADEKEQIALEVAKLIMDKLGADSLYFTATSKYSVTDICRYIDKNSYKLNKLIEAENTPAAN